MMYDMIGAVSIVSCCFVFRVLLSCCLLCNGDFAFAPPPSRSFLGGQIRRVTVLFVNLGLKEQTLLAAAVYDEAMREMHQVNECSVR